MGKVRREGWYTATLKLSEMTLGMPGRVPSRMRAHSTRPGLNVKPDCRCISLTGAAYRALTTQVWEAGNSGHAGKQLAAGQSTLLEGES